MKFEGCAPNLAHVPMCIMCYPAILLPNWDIFPTIQTSEVLAVLQFSQVSSGCAHVSIR